jgi:Protein of unknown function (DUF2971)
MKQPPLYKYLNVEGAKLTLGKRTFKHAKPSDFNDAEDMSIQSIFPEKIEQALTKLSIGFTDVVIQHLHDTPTCDSPMKEKLMLLQKTFRNNPKAVDLVKDEMAKGGKDSIYNVEFMRTRAEAYITEINEFMQGFRVFCVTTQKDSERMWSEYAENHCGIALRIEASVEKDSKFQCFRPVIYRKKRPPLYNDTLRFITDSLFGDQNARHSKILDEIVYAKTLEWEHESEYRLAIPHRETEKPWSTLPYFAEEITELYLGRAMEKSNMDQIVGMAKSVNPNIAIFRAVGGAGKKVEFECMSS